MKTVGPIWERHVEYMRRYGELCGKWEVECETMVGGAL